MRLYLGMRLFLGKYSMLFVLQNIFPSAAIFSFSNNANISILGVETPYKEL